MGRRARRGLFRACINNKVSSPRRGLKERGRDGYLAALNAAGFPSGRATFKPKSSSNGRP